MRKYNNQQEQQLVHVSCNMCGRTLRVENGILMEGVFPGEVAWGYFSHRDGESHSFDLCETCYEKMIAAFQIPVTRKEENELI